MALVIDSARRLDLVDVLADRVAGGGDGFGVTLAPCAVEQDQLGAAGEEARRAGLVDLDMRIRWHRMPR